MEGIQKAVIEYKEDACARWCETALKEGIDAYEAIRQGLAVEMDRVGEELYTLQEYFVPELLLHSDALLMTTSMLAMEKLKRFWFHICGEQNKNLPSMGGRDCHKKEHVGRAFTLFDHPVSSMAQLIQEIRKGNCRGVWQGDGTSAKLQN